jgi:RNA polymerase sigma-70 factor, ECF subfamily
VKEKRVAEVESIQNWIEAARHGDEQGFLSIYRSYSKKVRGLLVQLLGPEHLDDNVQEVFLRVWKGLSALREAKALSSWIYRTTWNVAMDVRKRSAKQRAQLNELTRENTLCLNDSKTEAALDAKILVEKALGSLDFEHRAVVVLVDLEDLSLENAAQIMNIPAGTVKSRLFNARTRLRQFLESKGVSL